MKETNPEHSATRELDASLMRTPADELADAQALAKAVHRIHALASGARVMADPDLRDPPANGAGLDGLLRALEGLAEAISEQAEGVMEPASDLVLAARIRAEQVRP